MFNRIPSEPQPARNWTWLKKFVGYRVSDGGLIRLRNKWLKAGVMDNGVAPTTGVKWMSDCGLWAARRASDDSAPSPRWIHPLPRTNA